MQLVIKPYEEVGPLRFGMPRSDVRVTLKAGFEAFRRAGTEPVDAFDDLGLFVCYDSSDCCVAVEMASPSEPVFRERHLLGQPYAAAASWLREVDPQIEEDDSGVTARNLGIGLYCPSARKDPASPVESVIAFARGYYDS